MTCEEYRIVQEIDQKLTAVIQYVNQLQTNYQQKCQEVAELEKQLTEANRRADAAIKEMKLIVDAVREEHCDDTCCFACMFDCDTSITWTGDHANECPGFELNDCFLWRGAEKGGEHGKS